MLMSFQSHEIEIPYMSDDAEEAEDNFIWSEQEREHTRQWVSLCLFFIDVEHIYFLKSLIGQTMTLFGHPGWSSSKNART